MLFPTALREMRNDLRKRPVVIGMLALGIILGISGPFDTLNVLSAVPRVIYWTGVVVLTFATGSVVSNLVHRRLAKQPNWLACGISALAIGIAVNAVLSAINLIVFGLWFETWASFFNQLGMVVLISAVVEFSGFALRKGAAEDVAEQVPVLDRLPFDKRGELIALSAEDHYVRVATTKGAELVLMRLSDAVKEVGDTAGLQVHRSHWIAIKHIAKITRTGDRAEVLSSDGSTRPISRGYMPAAREAGLLPKRSKS